MKAPTATTVRQAAAGRGTKNTSGTATRVNRIATSRSGGTPARPLSITTKLTPQTTATRTASELCLGVTPSRVATDSMKHQRCFLDVSR